MSLTPTPEQVPFDGDRLTLGRVEYVVPALPMRDVKKLLGLAAELDVAARATDPAEKMVAMGALADPIADLLFLSLRRNYPDLSADFVAAAVDLPTFQAALPVLMRVNGLAKRDGAEGKGVASRSRSTGARSTRG